METPGENPNGQEQVIRLLIVDDDEDDYFYARSLLRHIEGYRFAVEWASRAEDALAQMRERDYDICLCDYRLRRVTGIELLRQARAAGFSSPVIFLTGQDDPDIDREALQAGASDYLIKGELNATQLVRSIRYAIAQKRAEEALVAARVQEVEIGSTIQRTLLMPQQPDNTRGMMFGIATIPSQSISGDYYDRFHYDEFHVDVLVGDVMGKGVAAALLGAATRAQFQRAVRQLSNTMGRYGRLPEPEEVVTTVHYRLSPELRRLDSFITLAYARFDLEKRVMTFVDCGAPPPIHYRAATQETVLLDGDNMPLGMSPTEVYRQNRVPIEPGDLFVFYSDGVTEAYSAFEDDLFGVQRLRTCIARYADCVPEVIVERVLATIRTFAGQPDGSFSDDLTCVAVRIADTLPEKPLVSLRCEFLAEAQHIDRIRSYFREIIAEHAPYFSEDERVRMEVGIVEAVNNIITHTYKHVPGRMLQIDTDFFSDHLRMALLDWGAIKFVPGRIIEPIIEEMPTSGFGLYILQQSFDTVVFDRDDLGRNRLTVQKWPSVAEDQTGET